MSLPKYYVGKCDKCGKDIWTDYNCDTSFRKFNNGKIIRCEECCQKMGIKRVFIKVGGER